VGIIIQSSPYEKLIQGLSFFTTPTDYAINNRLTPFISMQNHYNLIYREEEREMMPTLKVGQLS
jgi:aryl-alcohol dehydrogenase-like predicted oxidoreductase